MIDQPTKPSREVITEPDPGVPVLRGYLEDDDTILKVWCPYCNRSHIHGWDKDNPTFAIEHRAAHCDDGSPFISGGYYIGINEQCGRGMDYSELVKTADEYEKDDAKISIDSDGQWITLNFQYPYDIELKRIKGASRLLGWVLHLCTKSWMNTRRIRAFIKIVARHWGTKIDHNS